MKNLNTVLFIIICAISLVPGNNFAQAQNELRYDFIEVDENGFKQTYKGQIISEHIGQEVRMRTFDGKYISIPSYQIIGRMEDTTQSDYDHAKNLEGIAESLPILFEMYDLGRLHFEFGYFRGRSSLFASRNSSDLVGTLGDSYSIRLLIKSFPKRQEQLNWIFTYGADLYEGGSVIFPFLFGPRHHFRKPNYSTYPFIQILGGFAIGWAGEAPSFLPEQVKSHDLLYGWTGELAFGVHTKIKNTALAFSLGYSHQAIRSDGLNPTKMPIGLGFFRMSIGRPKSKSL